MIVQPVVEPMDRFTALVTILMLMPAMQVAQEFERAAVAAGEDGAVPLLAAGVPHLH